MEIAGRVAQANGRLKAANTGVTIEVKGNRFVLRATLPPKPGSKSQRPYQQRIFLSYHANPAGLKLAEQEARKVGALLDCKQFDWQPYVKNDVQQTLTVADWVEKFERDYFTRRERNPQSETTWKDDYLKVFKRLGQDQALTVELLTQAIAATSPDTRNRKRFVFVCTKLAEFAGLESDFANLRGRYNPKQVQPRDLPSDEVITAQRDRIPNSLWKRAYGLIATYGIRPHEVFKSSFERFPVLTVHDGTKTGYRLVYPYYPEWSEDWDLVGELPKVSGKNNSSIGNRVTHAFARYDLSFAPYDLRHCWAVRTIRFGLPDTLAARQMGHSVAVHTEIYHAWITADEQE
ncbi:MAG: site-specific integrase [Leptolyngbyaceae cyanobacterium RM2_2_4]|nr:site-specific integrase [Leptolyngbyaceae cyanobacterium RM2_2_4]